MNAWRPQASYPYGNFSDTSGPTQWEVVASIKGSLRRALTANTCTESSSQATNWPYPLPEISVPSVVAVVHSRYRLTSVPPQPNSPTEGVLRG